MLLTILGGLLMNKKEFLHLIAEKTNVSLGVADLFVGAFVESIQTILSEGDELNLPGLGKFEVKKRAARAGRNPIHRCSHSDCRKGLTAI